MRAVPYREPLVHQNFPVSLQFTDAPGAPSSHPGKAGDHDPSTLRIAFDLKAPPACFPFPAASVAQYFPHPRGATQHEIVFVFTAAFADAAAYEIREQAIADDQDGSRVIWRTPGEARLPLYPVGVADLAASKALS